MHPKMIPVTSSNIDGYQYVASSQLLLVTFRSGEVYMYEFVPQDVVRDFANATSKGTFFGKEIRSTYPTTKLNAVELEQILDNATPVPAAPPVPRKRILSLKQLVSHYPILNAVF